MSHLTAPDTTEDSNACPHCDGLGRLITNESEKDLIDVVSFHIEVLKQFRKQTEVTKSDKSLINKHLKIAEEAINNHTEPCKTCSGTGNLSDKELEELSKL